MLEVKYELSYTFCQIPKSVPIPPLYSLFILIPLHVGSHTLIFLMRTAMGKLKNLGRNDNTVPPEKNIIHFSLTFASEKKILLKKHTLNVIWFIIQTSQGRKRIQRCFRIMLASRYSNRCTNTPGNTEHLENIFI